MLLHTARGRSAAMLTAMVTATLAATAWDAVATSAVAATAHNSQAGSWGPTSHNCEPTPYFRAGGCASAALQDDRRYPFDVPPRPPRHRLDDSSVPADPFDN